MLKDPFEQHGVSFAAEVMAGHVTGMDFAEDGTSPCYLPDGSHDDGTAVLNLTESRDSIAESASELISRFAASGKDSYDHDISNRLIPDEDIQEAEVESVLREIGVDPHHVVREEVDGSWQCRDSSSGEAPGLHHGRGNTAANATGDENARQGSGAGGVGRGEGEGAVEEGRNPNRMLWPHGWLPGKRITNEVRCGSHSAESARAVQSDEPCVSQIFFRCEALR